MAVEYQWKWQRGEKLTVKMVVGAADLDMTWEPVLLAANLLVIPTQGCDVFGVVEPLGLISASVPVIVSEDIFRVQLADQFNPALGDYVQIEADGSVAALGTGLIACGIVVDYDAAVSSIAHIKALFLPNEQYTDPGA